MCRNLASRAGNASKKSSVLVITLATLVLVCALLLVFFDQATLNRQISFSSVGEYQADLLAHTAMNTINGDLRTEIAAGSTPYITALNSNIYIPVANFTSVPSRVDDQGFTNLVKQSSATSSFWSGAYYSGYVSPVRSAANNSTQDPSTNGHYIKVNRWNLPGLLGDPGSGSTPQIPSNYVPPDWVLVTRQGVVTNAATLPPVSTLADKTYDNGSFVVGRYAYAIYDEGALLDVNVAGYPQNENGTTFGSERGLLPQVNLTNLLANATINDSAAATDAGSLINWRNSVSAASASSYTNYAFGTTNGFTAPATGDQDFVGRRDLINYIKNNSQIPTAALQFIGTFTRDSDGPSYFPNPNRPKVSATQDDITNPKVLEISVQNVFTRTDGSQAVVGEPLLKHRFPLSRLALFQNPAGTTNGATNASLILKYFSLQQRSDGLWDYVDPDTGAAATTLPTIKTLAQVAATQPGREPNYWELLQAGVLTGSLGTDLAGPILCATVQNQSTTRQIFSMGLSIIDQYDTDDTPTVMNLGGTGAAAALNLPIAGVENLPYIEAIPQNFFQDTITTANPATNAYDDAYLFFMLWNPHRNSANALPGTFRIRVNGTVYISYNPGTGVVKSPAVTHANTCLQFSTSSTRNFSQIDVVRNTDADMTATTSQAKFPPGSSSPTEVGILMGQLQLPKTTYTTTTGSAINLDYTTPLTICLEKLVGSNWIPYQIIPSYQANYSYSPGTVNFKSITSQMNAGLFQAQSASPSMVVESAHSDPRTMRFGMGFGTNQGNVVSNSLDNGFNLIQANGAAILPWLINGSGTLSPVFTPSATQFSLADYAYNQTTEANYYADRDGSVRKGDSNPASTSTHGADSPYTYGDARPIVLNRAFTSVAEMGYAFRDDPWRSLNFSSQDSADGGLLDLFGLTENDNALRAGVLDVNGASTEVLTALLLGAYRDPSTSDGTPLTAANAATIAQAIRSALGSTSKPSLVLQNVADLPTLTSQIASALPDTFKFKREAVARSFADVMNTRTWNLMIDVIAQAGRYTPQAKSLDDFTVEGEKRYWVHVALDRFTGKIIDLEIEPVVE